MAVIYTQKEAFGELFEYAYSDAKVKIQDGEGNKYDYVYYPLGADRKFTETDEPIYYGEPMKYSTLSIKRELAKLGKWDAAKSLLTANGYWDDYVLANYLSETDSVFTIACAAMIANGIVTEEELKELLPKCVWTAE